MVTDHELAFTLRHKIKVRMPLSVLFKCDCVCDYTSHNVLYGLVELVLLLLQDVLIIRILQTCAKIS